MNRFFQPAITAVLLSAALVVVFVTLLGGSIVQAASYEKKNGIIVDPILDIYGSPHSYSGNNLEPNADLFNADLTNADLSYANLTNADLLNAILSNADLTNADLTNADLSYANLYFANLYNADLNNANLNNANLYNTDLFNANLDNANLTNADLLNAILSYATFSPGTTLYDGQTVLQHGFDTAGLQAYLEASPVNASYAGNLTIVPEPHTLLLASLASMGLTLRRRRWAR